jgi:hypothetical protein
MQARRTAATFIVPRTFVSCASFGFASASAKRAIAARCRIRSGFSALDHLEELLAVADVEAVHQIEADDLVLVASSWRAVSAPTKPLSR